MAKLHIWTQEQENYGTADVPHWKMKGCQDYIVPKFRGGDTEATEAVMGLRHRIELDNDHYRSQISGWKIVADDFVTDYEKVQLDEEGSITYPVPTLKW